MKGKVLVLLLAVGAAALFQGWFLGLGRSAAAGARSDGSLDQEYTRALAHGQSFLLTPPDPRVLAAPDPAHSPYIRLDASLYRGRYYLYFGIVPFVALLLPWHMATGTYLSAAAAIWVFCILGYLAYGAALLVAGRPMARRTPGAVLGIVVIGLVVSSGTWPLMARPAVYELENAAGYAFFGWAVFAAAWADASGRRYPGSLFATALAALALGCRPNYFPAVAVLVAYVLYRSLRSPGSPGSPVSRLAYPLLPPVAVCLGLAWWNYHRFGSPLDFGVKQFSQTDRASGLLFTSSRNIPYNLERYVAGRARLGPYFPFVDGQADGWFAPARNQEPTNQVYGFLFGSPFVLWALLAPLAGGGARAGAPALAGALALSSLGNLLYLLLIGFGAYRYPADFLGPVALAAGIGALRCDPAAPGPRRWILLPVLCLTVAWSACAALFETCSIAQVHALFDRERPGDFRRLGTPFNAAMYLAERIGGGGPRALRLTLVFPRDRPEQVEPLVVAGPPSAQDFLYAYYTDRGRIQFGFESMGRGGPVTGPIAVDYGARHCLDVFLGTFLPPGDHPLLAGLSAAELADARRTVRIRLDGKVVMESAADPHPVLSRLFVGESPDNPAFGRRFTGRMISIERPLLAASYFHPQWTRGMFGPMTLVVRLRSYPGRAAEPILSVGCRPSGGVFALDPLASGEMRLEWVRFGREPVYSSPVSLAREAEHRVDISAGSLLPAANSALWRQSDGVSIARRKARLTCAIDGRVVLDLDLDTPDTSPSELVAGRNMLGILGIADSIQGTVLSQARGAW